MTQNAQGHHGRGRELMGLSVAQDDDWSGTGSLNGVSACILLIWASFGLAVGEGNHFLLVRYGLV